MLTDWNRDGVILRQVNAAADYDEGRAQASRKRKHGGEHPGVCQA